MPRVHLVISGRVQGVFFRSCTQDEATRLGLTGWAKNLPTGQVEVVVEGSQDRLDLLCTWCRHGPPAAHVDHVEFISEAETGEFSSFSIRY